MILESRLIPRVLKGGRATARNRMNLRSTLSWIRKPYVAPFIRSLSRSHIARLQEKPKAKAKPRASRKSTGPAKTKMTELDESLPPLVKITDIFEDLVKGVLPKLVEVAQKLDGRKIRVATMCRYFDFPLFSDRLLIFRCAVVPNRRYSR